MVGGFLAWSPPRDLKRGFFNGLKGVVIRAVPVGLKSKVYVGEGDGQEKDKDGNALER